jgi:hypothetical protein
MPVAPPPDKPDKPSPIPVVDDPDVKKPKVLPVEPPRPRDSPVRKET